MLMLVKNRFAADFEFFNRIGPTAAIRSQWGDLLDSGRWTTALGIEAVA